jgi:hypothetical protein
MFVINLNVMPQLKESFVDGFNPCESCVHLTKKAKFRTSNSPESHRLTCDLIDWVKPYQIADCSHFELN